MSVPPGVIAPEAPPAAEAGGSGTKLAGSLDASAKATRLLFLGQVSGKVFRFVQDLMVGRFLGPVGFGIFSAASSLVFIFSEVALLGIQRGVLRFASVDETEGRLGVAAVVTRRGVAAVALSGIVFVTGIVLVREPLTRLLFGGEVSPWILPTFSLAIPSIGIYSVLQFRARAGRRFLHDTLIGAVAKSAFPCLLVLGFLLVGWGLWGTTAGFAGGMACTMLLALALTGSKLRGRPEAGASPPPLRDFLRVSLPLALASASILLMSELDKVMLAIFRPEGEVGIYNAAYRISRQTIILIPALNAAVSPWVAPLLAQGKVDDLARLYRNSTCWSVAAGWSAALLFVIFAKDFLGLFGSAFLGGAHLLILLALGQFVICAVGNAGVVLQYSGNEKKELANGVLVTGLNVTLNLALIPTFGPLGAAVATLSSLCLVAIRRLFQVRALLGAFPYDRKTLFVLAGGLAAAAVGLALRTLAVHWGGGAPVAVAAAVIGMGGTWAILLRVVGVTSEEAALLRLPVSWVKRADPSAS